MVMIARSRLYERMWTEPKRDVARAFGVTSDRLSRLCRRNRIPIPLQGFWNRSAGDRQGLKTPLPQPVEDWEIASEPSEGHVPDDRPTEKARWERELAERREAERVEDLMLDVESWAKSRKLREYIQARIDDWKSRGVDIGEPNEAGQSIAWATRTADRFDPLVPGLSVPRPARPKSFWEIMSSLGKK